MNTPPRAAILSATGLRKRYGERTVLAIDQFTVQPGEALLLLGSNGAGKSTLLRILAGLEAADAGQLFLHQQRLPPRCQPQLRGRVIYLHQHPYLFDCSVRDNIGYGLKSARLPATERQQRVEQALEWSGLPHLGERHAKTLSGGEKQRIALARAWVLRPELLLLDEPTANMDREARDQTYFLVRRLVNEGMAVVMTGHGIKSDHPMLTRSLLLEQGKLHPLHAAGAPVQADAQAAPSNPTEPQRRTL